MSESLHALGVSSEPLTPESPKHLRHPLLSQACQLLGHDPSVNIINCFCGTLYPCLHETPHDRHLYLSDNMLSDYLCYKRPPNSRCFKQPSQHETDVMMSNLSLLVAVEVVVKTSYGATIDDNGILVILGFQLQYMPGSMLTLFCFGYNQNFWLDSCDNFPIFAGLTSIPIMDTIPHALLNVTQ